jgi:hypothetical protein
MSDDKKPEDAKVEDKSEKQKALDQLQAVMDAETKACDEKIKKALEDHNCDLQATTILGGGRILHRITVVYKTANQK